jgi:cell division protein FtsA
LIDIGNNQTSFVVYEEMQPLAYGVIPLGGENVTKDISLGLQVDIKEAEKIKREKGIILFNDTEQIPMDEQIDTQLLSDIIAARYEDIFEKIKQVLIDIERD